MIGYDYSRDIFKEKNSIKNRSSFADKHDFKEIQTDMFTFDGFGKKYSVTIQERVIERFLWIPLRSNGRWHWLKKCYIKQNKKFPFLYEKGNDVDWVDIEVLSTANYLEWRLLNE